MSQPSVTKTLGATVIGLDQFVWVSVGFLAGAVSGYVGVAVLAQNIGSSPDCVGYVYPFGIIPGRGS